MHVYNQKDAFDMNVVMWLNSFWPRKHTTCHITYTGHAYVWRPRAHACDLKDQWGKTLSSHFPQDTKVTQRHEDKDCHCNKTHSHLDSTRPACIRNTLNYKVKEIYAWKGWRLWASDSFSNEKQKKKTIYFPEGMEVSTSYRFHFFLNFDTLPKLFRINHNI